MDAESAAGPGFDVEIELGSLAFGRQFQSGELLRHRVGNGGLNFLLQLLARSSFEWSNIGIAGVGDESAFGLGLDAVGESRDDAFEVHGDFAIVARLGTPQKTNSRKDIALNGHGFQPC